MVICLEQGASSLRVVQLMPLPSQNPIITGVERGAGRLHMVQLMPMLCENPTRLVLPSDTCLPSLSRQRPLDGCGSSISSAGQLPRILLMLELCMSGQALSMLRRSALAQTMNAFIGRFMCSRASATPPTTPPATPPGLVFDLAPPPPDDRGDLSS